MDSLALEKEVEAMESRYQSGAFPNYEIKAQQAAHMADKIHSAVSLLKAIKEQKEDFKLATVTP